MREQSGFLPADVSYWLMMCGSLELVAREQSVLWSWLRENSRCFDSGGLFGSVEDGCSSGAGHERRVACFDSGDVIWDS